MQKKFKYTLVGHIKVHNDVMRKWDVPDQYDSETQKPMSAVEKSTRDEILDYCSRRLKI